jgi:cytochrome c oxidase subunit II
MRLFPVPRIARGHRRNLHDVPGTTLAFHVKIAAHTARFSRVAQAQFTDPECASVVATLWELWFMGLGLSGLTRPNRTIQAMRGNTPPPHSFRRRARNVTFEAFKVAAAMRAILAPAVRGRDRRMMRISSGLRPILTGSAMVLAALLAPVTGAFAGTGQPSAWQMDFQTAVTPIMKTIHDFHLFVTIIAAVITLFVLVLLVIVMVRFRESANPTPSRTTHHTLLEVAWTVIPALILVVIAVPSFRLLFDQLTIPQSDLTVKATGTAQWTWTYEYPDHKFQFDSLMLQDKERKPDQPRLLAVDNEMVVPVNKTVRMQITAEGIIHAFAVPSFGIKIDAIPGRLNETWFRAEREGVYYGQCSELCGRNHAFMPIAVRVVSEQQFNAWLGEAKKKWATAPEDRPVVMAEAQR